MQAQKRRVHNQLGGVQVHHHLLQKYAFRVSDRLKIETYSQRDTQVPCYQLPDYYRILLKGEMG